MDKSLEYIIDKRLERVKNALIKNNMNVHIVDTAQEVAPLVQELIPAGASVANGGSVTLQECGVMDLLRSGAYNFLDREAPGAEGNKVYREAFFADAYLASANAITESGEIYEMDGNSNRVAAIAFGPSSVILVAGYNKIVANLEAARRRNAEIAAPANCRRLGKKTPCSVTGICSDCNSPDRICCTEMILRQQRVAGRIKVILVKEELGF